MSRPAFCVYDRASLHARLKALGPKIRAQGGMPDAGEYPTLTEILLHLVELGEWITAEETRETQHFGNVALMRRKVP